MYRLPNGELTASMDLYSRAWRALAEPIEQLTGYKLVAFDPDLQLQDGMQSIALPARFARKLLEGLAARGANKKGAPKVKLAEVRTTLCKGCGKRLHMLGRGRPRRTCRDCQQSRKKEYKREWEQKRRGKS